MQSVSRPMFYFCSGFCCPILYIVYHALCCSSNLFKMLFHYYFYLSWKMEMGNHGKQRLLVESWFNLPSRKLQETVYWPWIRTPRGEEKRSIPQIVNLHPCIRLTSWGTQSVVGRVQDRLGLPLEGTRGRGPSMPKTTVFEMKREQVCQDEPR